VYHADLWGPRQTSDKQDGKYPWLLNHDVSDTPWQQLAPNSPSYLFVPQDTGLLAEYEQGWKVTDIMSINAIGMNSHRDAFAVAFDAPTLYARLQDLTDAQLTDDAIREKYHLTDLSDFKLARARAVLRRVDSSQPLVVPCLYRPFDHRFVLYHPEILDRPRLELNAHFVGRDNLGLALTRQTSEDFAALAVDRVCGQHKIVARYDGTSIVPLYLYPSAAMQASFDSPEGAAIRRANLAPKFVEELESQLGLAFLPDGKGDLKSSFGPEDVFNYIYAVLYSPTYRQRYASFLQRDFPRVPITQHLDLFRVFCAFGGDLLSAH